MKGYWKGYLPTGTPEWSAIATSETNASVTATRPAEAGRTHFITGFEVVLHDGSPNDAVEVTLLDGATVVWRTSKIGNDPAVREHAFHNGLEATEGNAVSVTVAAGGVDVVADVNLSGFTR